MKTLVIGNSLEVFPIIENILGQDKNTQVTLLACEGVLPYERVGLPFLVASKFKEQEFYKASENFLGRHQHLRLSHGALSRVSVQRKYVTTQDKTQTSFDQMVLVDTGSLILPAVKGNHRTGVFDCWRLSSVKAMMQYLVLSQNVIVAATNIQGLNMACALKQIGKEVTILTCGLGLLPAIFDQETGLLLKQMLEAKGIRTLNDTGLEEILGDGEVKAVKLTSGKVLACDAVIFDEVKSDVRMFSQVPLPADDAICLKEFFQSPQMPFAPTYFGLEVLDGFFAGWTHLPAGGREYLKFDGPQNIYKKMYVLNYTMAGLVVFNAPSEDCRRLWELFQRQENITGHEEEIL